MKTDIEISQAAVLLPIEDIAEKAVIEKKYLEYYGKYKAKISEDFLSQLQNGKKGKLVLVTAINPTPAGEGKTTTSIGLVEALNQLGKKTFAALREPSMGPCMGQKGGATGGGYAQVLPMDEINLHFTGDIHAITAANNLLSAMIDNHIQQGNALNIDPRRIVFPRVLDMNDRALRNIVIGLGGKTNGIPREEQFIITVASEIMAILCLCEDLMDLKKMISKIIVAYNMDGGTVTAQDVGAAPAMAALLKDAVKPNIVQTIEHNPAFIHGGPFANIAHGCNSLRATKLALALSDITVTEAGFGADLGAEKFFNIKCRKGGLAPDAVVIVATIRALKYNGGVTKEFLNEPNVAALENGFTNLQKHVENIKKFKVPIVVALNSFASDSAEEWQFIEEACRKMQVEFAVSEVFAKGGQGGRVLAQKVLDVLENTPSQFTLLYENTDSIPVKIEKIFKEIYGASSVKYTNKALNDLKLIEKLGFSHFPVCIAKTQYSLSDDPRRLGRPENFEMNVRELKISAGAGFIVAITGDIMTMPGLPKQPAALQIDVTSDGQIAGLF